MGIKLLFENGDEVSCHQDFIRGVNKVPPGEYEAVIVDLVWKLTAPGFGRTENYGNGALLVFKDHYPTLISDYSAAYVAHCKCGCGGIIFAASDNPHKAADNAKEVALCIREGHTVSRMNALGVRAGRFGCQVRSAQIEMELILDTH